MEGLYKQSIFAVAHTNIALAPFNNAGRTLRFVVKSNVDASALEFVFSNRCGTSPLEIGAVTLALCDEEGELNGNAFIPVTRGGFLGVTLKPGEDQSSDVIPFEIKAGDSFAVSLYFPLEERIISGNWVSSNASRSRMSNYSADRVFNGPKVASRIAHTMFTNDMAAAITGIGQIVAHSQMPGRVVGCFGDSITQQGNWTVPFDKLLQHTYPGEISLCNLGISGNRLLHDAPEKTMFGQAGVKRFNHDLLGLQGLTHAILELGTNDLGQPGQDVPEKEMITLEQYIAGFIPLADELRKRKIKAYAATLCPRPIVGVYSEEREALRQRINEWIRTADCFDAVIDFDAVLRREDGKPGMKDGYALPDGLHPSPYGGVWMAKAIDLCLFGGENS